MKTVLKNVWAVTMNDTFEILEHASVCIDGSQVAFVGETIPSSFADAAVRDCHGKKLVMPGLVNGHTHLPMTLFRGCADDLPLQQWLETRIFPMEAKLTEEGAYWGATLALAELAAAGVTTINDMYLFPEPILKAVVKSGMRAILSTGLVGAADDCNAQLNAAANFFCRFGGSQNGLISIAIGPHAEYTSTVPYLEKCASVIASLGCRTHIHVSETQAEHIACKQHTGMTPVALLEAVGLLETRALLAHCVWVEESDLAILKRHGASVLHCPISNMKLGSGFAPVPAMLEQEIPIALGTDGAASNNALDLWGELRLAALIHKGRTGNAGAVSARQALYMATRGGALALGLEHTGCLAPGMRADLILVDIDKPFYVPMTDIVNHLVYGANSRDVELTMVDGRILYEKGTWPTLDFPEAARQTQHFYEQVLKG